MEEDFRQFLQRPENQQILEAQQRRIMKRALKAKEVARASEFRDKVLETDVEIQKRLAPFLKIPALRTIIRTFVNDENGDFGRWADNPNVIAMLTQAKKMLEDGHMTETDIEKAFASYLKTGGEDVKPQQILPFGQKMRLPIDQLVGALNEHLRERRKGNEYFRRGDMRQALTYYQRAKSIVDLVEGMTTKDQGEIDANKATVLMNIAAVHLTNKGYADAAENCSAALALQPESVKALIRRAKCFCFMHEYQNAAMDLAKVEELDPGCPEAADVQKKLMHMMQRGKKSDVQTYPRMFASQLQTTM